jgi:Uma2 family endonuclease
MPVRFANITLEEYLAFEESVPLRHEFVDGQIHAMTGARRAHHLIVTRLSSRAYAAAQSRRPCQVFASGMKLHIEARNRVYYPDIFATCDSTDRDECYATRPCFIVEVLSRSTASIDRREKRIAYQALPSLQEYAIVSQDRMRVELYQREETGWTGYLLEQPEDSIWSSCLGLRMTLADLYQDVTFAPPGVAEESPDYEPEFEPILWVAQAG